MSIPTPVSAAACQQLPPTHTHHNRDLALQKYLLLQEQHASLRQHLDELRLPHSASSSPNSSPTRIISTSSFCSFGGSPTYAHSRTHRRTSFPPSLPPVLDETIIAELAADEAKLCDVNESIKRTLTELLNCEAVRGDRAMRTWVQSRLMDTERELRSGRRRRSAPEP